jgi:hypothetical protein
VRVAPRNEMTELTSKFAHLSIISNASVVQQGTAAPVNDISREWRWATLSRDNDDFKHTCS